MDNKVIGVVVLVCAIVAVAGVIVYNNNFNTSVGNNTTINTINNNTNNNTTSNLPSNQLSLTLSPNNQGSVPGPGPSPGPNPTPSSMDKIIKLFDQYVKYTFAQSGVPGAAVAIVQNGKIIYMKTFGVRDVASGAPVTPDTLFEIGSCSKAFTATNVAQLVDKGLMNWDDPVSKYFPELKLYDPVANKYLTIRDCLCHRSGLPTHSGDIGWTYFNDSFSQAVYKLRYIKNDTTFRSTFNYQNIIYTLGGYSAARVKHTTWHELIKKDLLIRLGMTTATTKYNDFLKSKNHALSYLYLGDGSLIPYHVANLDGAGPAGSIGSSINEMVNWLKFQMADTGMYNGKRIVSKKNLDETKTGQIFQAPPDTEYCLGWSSMQTYKNHKLKSITHSGGTVSSNAYVEFFTSKNIGIVILDNEGFYGKALTSSLAVKLHDILIGDYSTNPWLKYKEQNKPYVFPDPTPPFIKQKSVNTYTGIYYNSFYGNIKITAKNNVLICNYGTNKQSYKLKHWNNNTFNDLTTFHQIKFDDIQKGKFQKLSINMADYSTVPASEGSVFKRKK